MDELNGKFWMVWNPNGRQPTYKHPTKESAIAEAGRLARMNPNERFYVLLSLGHMRVCDPCQWTPAEDGLPF